MQPILYELQPHPVVDMVEDDPTLTLGLYPRHPERHSLFHDAAHALVLASDMAQARPRDPKQAGISADLVLFLDQTQVH